jgi:DnaJ-class molecular chaperone
MRKTCEECNGTGYTNELDGDGHSGEVVCRNCHGTGQVAAPDAERDQEE